MKKLVNFRLPLFIALSLVAGIVCAFNFRMQNHLATWLIFGLFVISLLGFLAYGIINKTLKKCLIVILAFLMVFSIGSFALNKQVNKYNEANLNYHYYTVEGRVCSIYKSQESATLVIEKADISGNLSMRLDYKISLMVYGEIDERIDLGSRVSFFALLMDRDMIYNCKPSVYGIADNIKYTAIVNAQELTFIDKQPTAFHSVHIFLRDTLIRGLDDEEFSVAYAMLLGQDDYMDSQTLSQFRSAGVAHIFAVSGLHIGFLATIFIFLFKKTRVNEWLSLILTALILIFYSGVCGFSSSSIRATIMCITLLLCNNLGFKYDGLTSVSLSAVIILLISPIQIFTAGFALSFGVVLGIILLTPVFMRALKKLPYKLSSLLSSVISAQLVSIPICLIFFNSVSVISIIFNLAILPIIGVVYTLTFLSTLLGGMLCIPSITLFISNYVFKALIYLFTLTDFSIFMVGGISLSIYVLLYYLALLVFAGFFNLGKILKASLCIVLIISFICASLIHNVVISRQTRVYVIGEKETCVVALFSKEEDILVINAFSSYSSLYRIDDVLKQEKTRKIDAIIITNLYNQTDIHTIVTKLYNILDFERVYYYGESLIKQENAIKLSFGNDKVVENFVDGENIPIKSASCSFVDNGYAVEMKNSSYKILAFSKLPSQPSKAYSSEIYDLAIAYNYQEAIFSLYQTKNEITFFNYNGYKDAYSKGYLLYSWR